MSNFLKILIIILCTFVHSYADDVKEFQLDVISLGDSALKYFTKNELKNSDEEFFYKNKTFKYYFFNTTKFKPYDGVQVTVKNNDPNYKIYNLDVITWIDNFEECKMKMENVTVEGADLAKEIAKKVNEDFDNKKLPLMLAMINAIVEDKKLELDWEAFR